MPTTFAEFISEQPGLTQEAVAIYLHFDAEASRIGTSMAACRSVEKLRANAVEYAKRDLIWLSGCNAEMAKAMATDVRLLALPSLHVWARLPDCYGGTWCNWYERLLRAHVEHEAQASAPVLVAAE